MGHEIYGTIYGKGSEVESFEIGDNVICPFTFFAATSALSLSHPSPFLTQPAPSTSPIVVILGCGPVGLCALISASVLLKPSHLIVIDSVPSRLSLAEKLGAEPLHLAIGTVGISEKIKTVTEGRGADIVLEIVGNASAIKLGFDILRPFGTLVSVGVHSEDYPWNMDDGT
ncbi:putative alcohol dehydrogenase [Phaeomoniella chlamydospora]|uniref:Putative alcohol dehydrogenase n=1 Tax=Phaeomoniella chlamydospora TaxID=158046 RepID=A0A0G2ERU1_PHACM|nr:putative alcohol dehydrogenase [Phaeomoniella chlamydospora]